MWTEGEGITVLLAENLGGETQPGPGDLCGEQRLGWGLAMRSEGGEGTGWAPGTASW